MIKNILESIPGIAAFPIVGLVIFIGVFLGVAVWALFYVDKKHRQHMKELPLEDSNSSSKVGD